MSRWQAPQTTAEIIGMTVASLTTSIMHQDIAGLLQRHGLDNINPEVWYPAQNLINLFQEISDVANASPTFVSIGMAAAQIGLDAMPDALKALPIDVFFSKYDEIWQKRHRNGDIGHIHFEKVDDYHMILRFTGIYPDDVFYGAFYAYARHYRPNRMGFSVTYDENVLRQDEGGEETVVHIRLTPQ